MDRRRFLAICSGGAVIGIGGCLGQEPAGQDPADGTETTADDSRYELVSFESSSRRTKPEHRYIIDRDGFAGSLDDERTAIKIENLSSDAQSTLRNALSARSDPYSTDEIPEDARTAIEEYDFVDFGNDADYRYVEFRLLEVDVESPPRLTVEARLLDNIVTSTDPAVLKLTATNEGDKTIIWHTGTPKPFGIQKADGLVLWTDAYEETGAYEDGKSVGGSDEEVSTELNPGGTVAEEYEVQSDRDTFKPGEFALDGALNYRFEGGQETVSYEVRWEIRELNTDQEGSILRLHKM
jgi:hypothetical protein